ncbi:MAG: translation initiation factor IF-2 [Xenococcaceae cyanobacterium MO_188.B32]|nr:translation initiation factor IF-2 [Xenococcaceae cyanobacterium MO_188.B32]
MGFADLSIAEIPAADNLPVEQVFTLCARLEIAYKNQNTCLALEDAKAVILAILSARSNLDTTG